MTSPSSPTVAPTPTETIRAESDITTDRNANSHPLFAALPSWIEPRLYTVAEAAALLHLSQRQIHRLIAEGRLRACRIGRALRVSPEALAELVTGDDRR